MRRRRLLIALAGTVAAGVVAVLLVVALGDGGTAGHGASASSPGARSLGARNGGGGGGAGSGGGGGASQTSSVGAGVMPHAPYAVGVRVLHLVDQSRTVQLPSGRVARPLVTVVRYPALGAAGSSDRAGAPAARPAGPLPLIVFGHGFAVTPGLYRRMLHAWAQAGYVVAAPVFPLEQANAPGGPRESDLGNQPQDMRFVISQMLGQSAVPGRALSGLIDAKRIAVAGQSDGGDTALAVAYDRPYRDPRVRAAAILSGAEIPNTPFAFPRGANPPLLATQGSADTVNPPSSTDAFFEHAPKPKYLLTLPGATHLPPYSIQQPQLGVVERVTIAFFDAYLRGKTDGIARRLAALGNVSGVATLRAQP